MQHHVRPRNWVLVILAILLFICSAFCIRQVVSETEQMSYELETEMFTVFVFILQITTTVYCVFSFFFVFKLARQRSYGCNSKVLNKIRTTGFGILGLTFLIVALIATLLQLDRFGSIGVFLLVDAFTSLVLCFIFWQREQLINDFVERILHANSLSSNFLTEQNARDLFKLKECDQEFTTYIRSFRFFCQRPIVHGIRHSEYYHLQKWSRTMQLILDGKESIESIADMQKEMVNRAAFLELNPKTANRYDQLANLPLLILPGANRSEQTMTRDSSFLVHGKTGELSVDQV
ncbi:hypothetical protein M3Y98_00917100 [Aphelenchoides besseyi]|nr:hypothetical protein M3Y98_00917100 [Aphelenchoides besseyi]KAI6193473.1 hypothetical protein M3Y96_01021500 [Aphelenchoides besseyi]